MGSKQTSIPLSVIQGTMGALERLYTDGGIDFDRPHLALSLAACIEAHAALARLDSSGEMVAALQRFFLALRDTDRSATLLGSVSALIDGMRVQPACPSDVEHEDLVRALYTLGVAWREGGSPLVGCMAHVAELACWARRPESDMEMALAWCVVGIVEALASRVGEHAAHEFIAWLSTLGTEPAQTNKAA